MRRALGRVQDGRGVDFRASPARGLGCAPARVPSRALRVPRHPPESRPQLLVGRDADGGQYSGKTDCLGVSRRVDSHDRVDRGALGVAVGICVMERGQALAEVAHRGRERVVGAVHVGPKRVAADLRAVCHLEDRQHRRPVGAGEIAVSLVGDAPHAAACMELEEFRSLRAQVEVRVRLELPEELSKPVMLVGIEALTLGRPAGAIVTRTRSLLQSLFQACSRIAPTRCIVKNVV